MFYISRAQDVRFPKRSRTFSIQETYVSAVGNIKKLKRFPAYRPCLSYSSS